MCARDKNNVLKRVDQLNDTISGCTLTNFNRGWLDFRQRHAVQFQGRKASHKVVVHVYRVDDHSHYRAPLTGVFFIDTPAPLRYIAFVTSGGDMSSALHPQEEFHAGKYTEPQARAALPAIGTLFFLFVTTVFLAGAAFGWWLYGP